MKGGYLMTQRRCSKCGSEQIKWSKNISLHYICQNCGFIWYHSEEIKMYERNKDFVEYCPISPKCKVIDAYRSSNKDLLTSLMQEKEFPLKQKIAKLHQKINRQSNKLRICEHCKYSNASHTLHLERRLTRLRKYYKHYKINSIGTTPYGDIDDKRKGKRKN